MILSIKNSTSTIAPKLTYDVLIENQPDGTVKGTLLGLPGYQGLGATKEEALEKIIHIFQERKPEIVTLEIEPPQTEHPWMKFAGMHKDNPLFGEVLEHIETERCELDAEMEEHYQLLDAEIDEYQERFIDRDTAILIKLLEDDEKSKKQIDTEDQTQ